MPNYVLFGFKLLHNFFLAELKWSGICVRCFCELFALRLCLKRVAENGLSHLLSASERDSDKQGEMEECRWMRTGMSKLTGCVCATNRFKPGILVI